MYVRSGSLMVHCKIEVPEDSPGYLPMKLREALAEASERGEFGGFSLDPSGIDFCGTL